MKRGKLIQKTIFKLAEGSIKDGKILESKVTLTIKALKTLKGADSIFALSEYLKELKRRERQFTMYIETAIPLSSDLLKKVKKIVDKKHKITKVKTQVNPQILGGFKLKIGDEVWDETVRSKMKQIKEAIIS